MRIDAGRSRLYDAQKTIQNRWQEVCEHWNDPVQKEFEAQTWEPLEKLTRDALTAMDRLSALLREMRSECEGEEGGI